MSTHVPRRDHGRAVACKPRVTKNKHVTKMPGVLTFVSATFGHRECLVGSIGRTRPASERRIDLSRDRERKILLVADGIDARRDCQCRPIKNTFRDRGWFYGYVREIYTVVSVRVRLRQKTKATAVELSAAAQRNESWTDRKRFPTRRPRIVSRLSSGSRTVA